MQVLCDRGRESTPLEMGRLGCVKGHAKQMKSEIWTEVNTTATVEREEEGPSSKSS